MQNKFSTTPYSKDVVSVTLFRRTCIENHFSTPLSEKGYAKVRSHFSDNKFSKNCKKLVPTLHS